MRKIYIIVILLSVFARLEAQELNVTLNLNAKNIQSVDEQMISSLDEGIKALFNENRWTDATFEQKEKIDCIVAINLVEMPTINSFKAEIQITSRRPVYNSTYVTPVFNFRDKEFEFEYTLGEMIEYNNNNISNNLVATLAFYSYVVIGMDFDSFSMNGGRPYFEKAMDIANSVQSINAPGWKPFSGKINKYDLAVALTEENSKEFHEAWYNYHRLGLDIMESNQTRARLTILEAVGSLEKLRESRPSSPLLSVFAEAKLDEILRVCSKSTSDEKKDVRTRLVKLFPAKSREINELK